MKILVASDIHGDYEAAKKLLEKAVAYNVDLILLAGDIVNRIDGETKGVLSLLLKSGKKIVLVRGNHEDYVLMDWIKEYYQNVYVLDGDYIRLGNIVIIGAGGAENAGPFPTTKSVLFEKLRKALASSGGGEKTIVVAHEPPEGSLLSFIFPGSSALDEFIKRYQPDIVVCGHIHETFGLEDRIGKTIIINPGPEGKIIEV